MNKKKLDRLGKSVAASIAKYERRLAEYRQIQEWVDKLPQSVQRLPVHDVYLQTWDFTKADLKITVPWRVADIAEHRLWLEADGWVHSDTDDHLERQVRYENYVHPDLPFELHLIYDAALDGASCVITKIGEKKEVKEVVTPVFEVTCPDGAAEEVFA